MEKQVVIIGAGMAGVSAARTLYQNGITNIVILEGKKQSQYYITTKLIIMDNN